MDAVLQYRRTVGGTSVHSPNGRRRHGQRSDCGRSPSTLPDSAADCGEELPEASRPVRGGSVLLDPRQASAVSGDADYSLPRALRAGARPGGIDRERPVSVERRHCPPRSEEHTSELQSLAYLVCRLLLEKKKNIINTR